MNNTTNFHEIQHKHFIIEVHSVSFDLHRQLSNVTFM